MAEFYPGAVKTPWHLWLVGGVSLVWNAFGCLDYFMTQTRNADYLEDFTAEQVEFFTSFPVWVDAAWAFGVWGALAGSILLLLRSRWAVWAFGASIAGMAVSFVHNFLLAGAGAMIGQAALVMTGVIVIVALALFFYAWAMAARRVLR